MHKKTLLLILDGWGIGKDPKVSAIAKASPLFFDELIDNNPHATLVTYGSQVGLPEGQMGNSEVGHLNIGAGRIVYQELQRIQVAIESEELRHNKTFVDMLQYCLDHDKPLHLMGLYSDGGVHSHLTHLKAVILYAEQFGLKKVFVHAFTDGRDCDPRSAKYFLKDLEQFLADKSARLASVCGRYYAMDRDKRWERVKKAYDLLTAGNAEFYDDIEETLDAKYAINETDEFILPIKSRSFCPISEGDAVFCVNFRTDRCREITQVLTQESFEEYGMKPLPLYYVTMTEYNKNFKGIHVVFNQGELPMTIGEVLEQQGVKQLRMAETEKYPHVTFFFSGGREQVFEGEDRIMVPSPKVATYDLQPEMSAFQVKDQLLTQLESNDYGFIVVNFANTDMVGHTGVFEAAVKATQAVDLCLKEIVPKALQKGYQIVLIADHGNSDYMINPYGSPNTAHSMNLVPIVVLSNEIKHVRDGKLADVAPTILKLMGIEPPKQMTGECLI
jgi:2,3-bisphosphoglycerate-independent phosphoglycerate mutase